MKYLFNKIKYFLITIVNVFYGFCSFNYINNKFIKTNELKKQKKKLIHVYIN